MTVFDAAPYRTLTLTGPMGVGKTTIGREIARQLKAELYDLDNEILAREGQSSDQIREIFGEARLKTLEREAVHELSLRRSAVIVINGTAMLDEINRQRMVEAGSVLCLSCALNETLRRLHVARGAWFQSPYNRATIISRLKRERAVLTLELLQLDTSLLSVEETVAAVKQFWFEHAEA
ncbi:MAG: AAA family ATPase [Chloroflexi bacterium]|nr:AAA family ATPase [Chloroflexota bacterium]